MVLSMLTSAVVAVAIIALVSAVVLRGTVGLVARTADNGWDNALAYVAVTGMGWFLAGRYVAPLGMWPTVAAALLIPLLQLGALRWIYELRTGRALAVGVLHTVVASTVVTSLTLVVGVVAAYVMYGRIVQDPMLLVWIVLRLIGLVPADDPP